MCQPCSALQLICRDMREMEGRGYVSASQTGHKRVRYMSTGYCGMPPAALGACRSTYTPWWRALQQQQLHPPVELDRV